MKKNLLFSLTAFIFNHALSQCNPAIPNNAVVISYTQAIGFGSAQLWVCSNDSLTTNGGSETIYLESGAYVLTNGGSNTVYVPAGAKVNTPSGGNTIYYVNAADLVFTGSAVLIQCPGISYNYSNAPTPGCTFTTGISGSAGALEPAIFPNPSSGIFTVFSPVKISAIEFTNVFGNLIQKSEVKSKKFEADLSNEPRGIYFLKVSDETGNFSVKKIVLQ